VPFNESTNPLFYLRTKNMYPTRLLGQSGALPCRPLRRRRLADTASISSKAWRNAKDPAADPRGVVRVLPERPHRVDLPESSSFQKGELFKDIGYWNLMFHQLGSEGFGYTADGNG